ncbi:hypothetical protein AB0M47_40295 [Hamadaea sp. NPDC051192]|uniref:hypothetical protein n=1 Tax=Hamadaea sp. NPDC051192 TaxID=3154940 RepID=UPI00344995E1
MAEPTPASATFRLSTGLVRFAAGSAYVFEGGPTSEAFTGPGAVDILPELCDLLDGTRTTAEISAKLRIPLDDTLSALAQLAGRGLAQRVEPQTARRPPEAVRHTPALAFFERTLAFSGRSVCAEQTAGRIRDARVLLAGGGALHAAIEAELARCGVACEEYALHRLGERQPVTGAAWADTMVIEVIGDSAQPRSALSADALGGGHLWLAVGAVPDGGFVGPMLHPSTSCLCQLSQPAAAPIGGTPSPAVIDLIAALVAGEVVNGLGGAAAVCTLNRRVELALGPDQAPRFTTALQLRQLTCQTCRGGAAHPEDAPLDSGQLGWDYEQSIEISPPALYLPAPALRPTDTVDLQRRQRSMPSCPAVACDALAGEPIRPIAALLRRTIGARTVQGAGPRRAVPTGGNLGSPQAFVISQLEIGPLASHCAWYDPDGDRFVATGRVGREEVDASLADLIDIAWDHVVVWVADLAKVAAKYGDFALRLVHLDAGVALSQAVIVAGADGLGPRMLTGWDATVFADLLDLDLENEVVTAVMVFSGADDE